MILVKFSFLTIVGGGVSLMKQGVDGCRNQKEK